MKKLLLTALVMVMGVMTASAWNDMYLICEQNNNWNVDSYNSAFKFVRVDNDHFRATVPGSYINNGNWNFRFREQNTDWWNVGPIGSTESDNTEVGASAVKTNYKNSNNASFYITQNANASFVQIFIEWDGEFWNVTASVITDTYTVAFANIDGWTSVNAYAYYFVDNCPKQEPLGSWSGQAMTNSNNIFTIEVPAISDGEIIFIDNNGTQYPQTGGFDIVENGVYGKSGLVESVSASIGAAGYSTFSSAYPVDFTNCLDVTAYRAEQTIDNKVSLKKVSGKVPAATGLILKGTAGSTVEIPTTIATTSVGTNYLWASVKEYEIKQEYLGSDYYYFLAGTTPQTIGFYQIVNTQTSAAGKAFYHTATPLAVESNSRAAWIIEDETTGINAVQSAQSADVVYDLQGRQAKNAKAGLYIKNGKKFIVK